MSAPDPGHAPTLPVAAGLVLGGRYRLEQRIGRGGMGEVWSARDAQLEREVAIKLPSGSIAPEECDRLLREARMAAALNHPGVVAVHDAGVSDGQPFVVFERVAGTNLRAQPPAGTEAIRAVADQVLDALAHVHAAGIVHRDLKPENLLWVGAPGASRVKLADLGVARPQTSTTLSRNVVVGTAAYLSPEQATGAVVDGRADLYALGVTLYEWVAGRRPFEADDLLALVSQHLLAPVPPLRLHVPDVDPALERFVLRLLRKTPDERFADAGAARAALADTAAAAAGDAAPGAPAVLDQLVRGRLVGRTAELERLRAAWRAALDGGARLALVSGEPGIGKSRLAREVAVNAHVDGAVVMTGGCYEFEATTPYLPFVEAISGWARAVAPAALAELLGDSAADLARLVPDLGARLGSLPAAPALAPHEERLRLFEAIARFLRRLSARRGLLLLLDDLHWADAGTLALLRHLARQLRADRVLLLGTYREVELDRRHPLAAALVDWDRDRIATRVPLGRLDRAETEALLATLLQQEHVTAEFGEALHRETEGNPFFTEEVVKALVEQGAIYREGGEWQRRAIGELAIPQSVKSAIGRRLDRLSEGCAGVLHVAAVIGKTFEFADLRACTDLGEDALLDALDEAAAAQLVQAGAREAFAFTHDKIREVLVEELNPVRLRRLHLRVAERIESRDGAAEDLAYHFQRAGELGRARRWLLESARHARAVAALEEAADALAQARECAEALGGREEQLEVAFALVEVHADRGDLVSTLAACERGLALCSTDAERVRLLARATEVCVRHGDPRADGYIDAVERVLDPVAQPEAHVVARASRARVHHYRMEHGKALAILEPLAELPIVRENAWLAEMVYSYLAGANQHLARYEESMRWAQRSIDEGTRIGSDVMVATGREFLAEDLALLGRFREALAHGEEDLRLGLRSGSLDRQAWGTWCVAWAHANLGELPAALERLQAVRQLCDLLGERRLLGLADALVAITAEEAGRPDLADELLEEAKSALAGVRQRFMEAQLLQGSARVLFARGDVETAYDLAKRSRELKQDTDNRAADDITASMIAVASARLGRLDEAESEARACLAFEGLEPGFGRGWALRALAAVAAARGETDAALAHFSAALAVHGACEAVLAIARTHAERAQLLRTAGRAAEADADVARARELAIRCGAAKLLAELG